jgi:hypothetical protein
VPNFLPAGSSDLPIVYLQEVPLVSLQVSLVLGPLGGSAGGFGLGALLQAGVPVAEAPELNIKGLPHQLDHLHRLLCRPMEPE